jgi:hypothetical protein
MTCVDGCVEVPHRELHAGTVLYSMLLWLICKIS